MAQAGLQQPVCRDKDPEVIVAVNRADNAHTQPLLAVTELDKAVPGQPLKPTLTVTQLPDLSHDALAAPLEPVVSARKVPKAPNLASMIAVARPRPPPLAVQLPPPPPPPPNAALLETSRSKPGFQMRDTKWVRLTAAFIWLGVLAFVIGGASLKCTTVEDKGDRWVFDTISRMVTRTQGIQTAFAVYACLVIPLLGFAITIIMTRASEYNPYKWRWMKYLRNAVWICFVVAAVCFIGLAIASLEVEDSVHTNFAAGCFGSLTLMMTLLTFMYHAILKRRKLTYFFVLLGWASMIALAVSALPEREPRTLDPGYYYEYVLVSSVSILLFLLADISPPKCFTAQIMFVAQLDEHQNKLRF